MATLHREGDRVVDKGPQFQGQADLGSIPAQPPASQVMLKKSLHSCGAWPSEQLAQPFRPASGATGKKGMRSRVLLYAVSTQNVLKHMAGARSCLSPPPTSTGSRKESNVCGTDGTRFLPM